MQYPNTRYANPIEMQFYAQGIPIKDLSKRLRRSEKSVRAWLKGERKIPWWIPELLRLQHTEHQNIMRQMNFNPARIKLGLVSGTTIEFNLDSKRTGIYQRPTSRRCSYPNDAQRVIAPCLNTL